MAKLERSKRDTKKIRYAVVGLGHIAQVAVLPAFKHAQNSEVAALVSSDPTKIEDLGKKYKVDKIYSYDNYDNCLASGIDAVYLSVPNHLHKEYSVRAAKAGVHVLCEKPMAVTEEECHEMIEAAKNSQTKLMIAYRLHFEKGNLSAIEIGKSGKLGELRIFTSEFTQQVAGGNVRLNYTPEQGGGPVYDMGVYCINAARYIFGAEPTEVIASSATKADERFAKSGEMVSATLHFPDDRLATFTASFGATPVSRYSVIGTKGMLTLDPAYEYAEAIKYELNLGDNKKKKVFPKSDQFAAELVYFSDCILQNREPEPSGIEGLADVRIVQAIYESVRTGKAVKIPQVDKASRPDLSQNIYRPPVHPPEPVHAVSPSGEAA